MKQIAILIGIITLSITSFDSSAINKSFSNNVNVNTHQNPQDTTKTKKQNDKNKPNEGFDILGLNIKSGQTIRPLYHGGSTITIGDYELQFAGYKKAVRYNGGNIKFKGEIEGLEFSRILAMNTDYSMYPTELKGFIDLTNKSLRINWNFIKVNSKSSHRIRIGAALGFTWENYVWYEDMILRYNKDTHLITPEYLTDKEYKKTKLMQFGLHMPIRVTINFNKKMYIGVGVYGDWFLKQHSKVKFPKSKPSIHHVNPYQLGTQATLGFNHIYLIGSYSFTPLFEKGYGPRIHPSSFGIGFGF